MSDATLMCPCCDATCSLVPIRGFAAFVCMSCNATGIEARAVAEHNGGLPAARAACVRDWHGGELIEHVCAIDPDPPTLELDGARLRAVKRRLADEIAREHSQT